MKTNNLKETNLRVEDFEDKGKYTLFKTSEGFFGCWDKELSKTLREYDGTDTVITVKYTEKQSADGEMTFKNIRDIVPIKHDGAKIISPTLEPKEKDVFVKQRESKDLMMKVSYAKDIFNGFEYKPTAEELEKGTGQEAKILMHWAIELVKQAEKDLR